MNRVRVLIMGVLFAALGFFTNCDENGNIILFSLQNDKDLGAQVAAEIESNPQQFPVLPRSNTQDCPNCAAAYAYLDVIVNNILNSGEVTYNSEFVWQVSLIKDDETLNAFATPGGYIYVYTGLIKFLDRVDDLAGVLGHEIAHADQRHSSRQLQRQYGVSILLSVILGEDPTALEQIAAQISGTLSGLSFSRGLEEEADEFSVIYLAETPYACNGAFSFFQKLLDEDASGNTPEFLSTHPDPADRVAAINAQAEEIGCATDAFAGTINGFTYEEFQLDLLPD